MLAARGILKRISHAWLLLRFGREAISFCRRVITVPRSSAHRTARSEGDSTAFFSSPSNKERRSWRRLERREGEGGGTLKTPPPPSVAWLSPQARHRVSGLSFASTTSFLSLSLFSSSLFLSRPLSLLPCVGARPNSTPTNLYAFAEFRAIFKRLALPLSCILMTMNIIYIFHEFLPRFRAVYTN